MIPVENQQYLDQLAIDKTAVVVSLGKESGFRKKMSSIGIFRGVHFRVLQKNGKAGLIVISTGSTRIMIGANMARRILVTTVA